MTERLIAYDVVAKTSVFVLVDDNRVWCDPVGSPLADQTRYSRIFPEDYSWNFTRPVVIPFLWFLMIGFCSFITFIGVFFLALLLS